MAKAATNKSTFSLKPLDSDIANDPNVSQSFKTDMGKYYKNAIDEIQSGSFAARHPILNAAKNAVVGGAVMGPAGLFMMPLMGAYNENNRVNGIRDAFQTATKNRSEIEKNLLEPRQAGALGSAVNTAFNNDAYKSPLASGAPVSVQGAEMLLKNSPMVQDQYRNLVNDQKNTALGAVGTMLGQTQTPYDNTQGQSLPPFNASAETTQEVPLRPYHYVDNSMLQKALDNNQQLLSTGITQAPKYAQLPYDIQKTLSEVLANNALTGYRNQQTVTEQQRPALIKAQTGEANAGASLKNRTDPNLRARTLQTTANMGYELYVGGKFGQPGSPEAIQGLQNFLQQPPSDSFSVTTDKDGNVTSKTTTSRSRGGSPSNSQAVQGLINKYKKNPPH